MKKCKENMDKSESGDRKKKRHMEIYEGKKRDNK